MTQEQLAWKAKVTSGHLAQLELGQVATPRLDVVRRLARALGVPLKELLG
jgi:transcriptional regulator with XRE-family HTH domain